LENVNDRTWENIKENTKISAKECLGLYKWKQHKSWFDDEFSQYLDQRKKAKCSGYRLQTRAMYAYKLNNVRHEANRHYRNKRRNKLKTKIYEIETQSETKIINDVYQ